MRKTIENKSDLVKAVHEMAAHRQGKLALSARTLRVPEQGRRVPERSARILLTLIAIDRRAVDGVIRKLSA